MGIYWYITNITKNQEIFLGKIDSLYIQYFLKLFNENKWEYSNDFRVHNDNYDEPFHIRFRNDLWEYFYPAREEEIISNYIQRGDYIDSDLESYYPEKEEEIISKYSKDGRLI
jgi:hypothetical protein